MSSIDVGTYTIEVPSRIQKISVVSRTQRIIVAENRSVSVVNAGPQGPPGPPGIPGTANESASGTQATPSMVWIMDHDRNFYPAGFRFFTLDETEELEPESITYVSSMRTLATWPEPIAGKWRVS